MSTYTRHDMPYAYHIEGKTLRDPNTPNKSNRKELDNLCFSSIWCIGQVEELASCLIRRTRGISFFHFAMLLLVQYAQHCYAVFIILRHSSIYLFVLIPVILFPR